MLLLAFTAISFVALIALGWRSLDRFEATVERVLLRASAYTAEQVSQEIQRDLRSPVFDLLEQVDHAAIRRFDVPRIAETLRSASSRHFGLIDTFFVWSLAPGTDPRFAELPMERRVLFYASGAAQTIQRDPSSGTAADHGFFSNPRLATILLGEAGRWAAAQKPFALSHLEFKGRSYQVVYHYVLNSSIDRVLGGVEGFLADGDTLPEGYFDQLVSERRARIAEDPALPLPAVSILNTAGDEVSRSGRSLLDSYDATARFPFAFLEPALLESLTPYQPLIHYWTVRAGYEAGDISAIAREQTLPQRWAWMLSSLVAAVGIGLTARSVAREMRVSDMKSEFVAGMSHDLRTPLAKIQLFADTLRSGHAKSPERLEFYSSVISTQARKLAHLLQELMDFSKIEAGVRTYEMDHVDLRTVLMDALEMFDGELSQDEWTSEIVLPDRPVHVLGNVDGLQQLFTNLISNAIKYSPDECYLRVALETSEGKAVIQFTDRGIGIPGSEHRRIFKKYYRGASAAHVATGSGIGLAIVDHVVRAHGGTVSVTNHSGLGTTFTVTLPVVGGTSGLSEAFA